MLILESRLNNHSLEELNLFTPFVQSKVDILKEKYPDILRAMIFPIHSEKSREIRGLTLKQDGVYVAEKKVRGVRHYIKSSKDKRIVVKALAEFCIQHDLEI